MPNDKAMVERAEPDHPDLTDMEEALLVYCNTADELRHGYEATLHLGSNLPGYSRLVRA